MQGVHADSSVFAKINFFLDYILTSLKSVQFMYGTNFVVNIFQYFENIFFFQFKLVLKAVVFNFFFISDVLIGTFKL